MNFKKSKKRVRDTKRNHPKYFNNLEVVIIMIITLFVGMFLGSVITFTTTKKNKSKTSTTVQNKDQYLQEFEDSYNNILSNYYNSVSKEELIDSAIKGMVSYLDDPYAIFMNSKESTTFQEDVEGEYIGIGCEISISDKNEFYITKVMDNSPASQAGLKVQDVVVSIDNNAISGKSLSEVTDLIKGKENTKVTLKIKDKTSPIELTRKKITITSVNGNIIEQNNKKIGLITISIFASNTKEQFKEELKKLEDKKIDSLIIDVRDNTGGYLSSVEEIVSMFLQKNKIIYQLSSKGIKEPILDETKEKRSYPIVVLINETSASASEILAASLKDSYKSTIVGVKSYGKGTVQKAYTLKDGSVFKYTIQEWLTPKGESIDKVGITPDVEVRDKEEQLNKAIEILSN